MIVSTHWLKDYLPKLSASTHEISERLTMTLTEVEDIRTTSHLKDIVVGEILKITPHPDADRLNLTKTKVGSKVHDIVCGADNIFVGAKVPVALPGVTLPDGLTIEKRKIRGTVSDGMLCSARELGLSDDHTGIWLLPADTKVGESLAKTAAHADTFDLDVLANRPDCLGHLGIAREVAAAFTQPFVEPNLKTPATKKKGDYTVKRDPKLSSRYSFARLTGLTNGESPDWVKERLVAVGLRPINAVVDITNFVMLESGQPLHAFDAAKLPSPKLGVRAAKAGESLTLLNGLKLKVPAGVTLITSGDQPVALGGIMGGEATEVDAHTIDILLESANFDQAHTRRSSRAIKLRTDASARFEKGVSPHLTLTALQRAVDLLVTLCGATLTELGDDGIISKSSAITMDVEKLNDFLGVPVKTSVAKQQLTQVGCTVTARGKKLRVTPPPWRVDLHREVDCYEEVARLIGYDSFPSRLPVAKLQVPEISRSLQLATDICDVLVGAGLDEFQTHSLVGDELLSKTGSPAENLPHMANPLTSDHAYLRGDLLPRHLEAVRANLRWRPSLEFFEIGRVFTQARTSKAPTERDVLAITLADSRQNDLLPRLRGLLTRLCESLHITANDVEVTIGDDGRFMDGRRGVILLQQTKAGLIGELADARPWKAKTICHLTLDLTALASAQHPLQVINPSEHPPVKRDISLWTNGRPSIEFSRAAREAAGEYLRNAPFEAHDVRGRLSVILHLELFAKNRTLTDKEAEGVIAKIEAKIRGIGGEIR